MGLVVLALYLLGVGLLAYGLGLVYFPLAPIVISLALLSTAYATGRTMPGAPK